MICWKSPRTMCTALVSVFAISIQMLLIGCGRGDQHQAKDQAIKKGPSAMDKDGRGVDAETEAEIEAERAKLSSEDRKLVETQEFCVVQTEQRLGSMGSPIKLIIEGQPVFLCCKACNRKAMSDPEKTLKTLEENKTRAKAKVPAKSSMAPGIFREFAGTVSGEVDGTRYAGDFKEEPEEKKPAKK
jgi:hypothetical protein